MNHQQSRAETEIDFKFPKAPLIDPKYMPRSGASFNTHKPDTPIKNVLTGSDSASMLSESDRKAIDQLYNKRIKQLRQPKQFVSVTASNDSSIQQLQKQQKGSANGFAPSAVAPSNFQSLKTNSVALEPKDSKAKDIKVIIPPQYKNQPKATKADAFQPFAQGRPIPSSNLSTNITQTQVPTASTPLYQINKVQRKQSETNKTLAAVLSNSKETLRPSESILSQRQSDRFLVNKQFQNTFKQSQSSGRPAFKYRNQSQREQDRNDATQREMRQRYQKSYGKAVHLEQPTKQNMQNVYQIQMKRKEFYQSRTELRLECFDKSPRVKVESKFLEESEPLRPTTKYQPRHQEPLERQKNYQKPPSSHFNKKDRRCRGCGGLVLSSYQFCDICLRKRSNQQQKAIIGRKSFASPGNEPNRYEGERMQLKRVGSQGMMQTFEDKQRRKTPVRDYQFKTFYRN